MNAVYRIIWSAVTQSWTVVSELTAACGKQKSATSLALSSSVVLGFSLFSPLSHATAYTEVVKAPFTLVDGDTITVSGDSSTAPDGDKNYGTYATSGNTLDSTGLLTVSSNGRNSHGIFSNGGATNLENAHVTTNGDYAMGLYAGLGGIINSTGLATINTSGTRSDAVESYGKGGVINLHDAQLTTTGEGAAGVRVIYGGEFNSTGTTTIKTSGKYSTAVNSDGKLNLNNTDITTTGDGAYGFYASAGTLTSKGKAIINTSGNKSVGIEAGNTSTVTLADIQVTTTGDNSAGIQQQTTGVLNINGGSITTLGASSHGLALTYGSIKTIDGTLNNILPTIKVTGAGSAMVDAGGPYNGVRSQLTLKNQTLDISGAAAPNTWGAKAEAGGLVSFVGGSTGGTGLWATGAGSSVDLSGTNAAGSRVLLDTRGTLNIDPTGSTIGSLEGDTTGIVSSATAGGALTLGSNNATNNGSLLDNANYAGKFSNIGALTKNGTLTQILSGTGNTVGSVDVTGGTLRFEQAGAFTTTGNYTTRAGATTDIGKADSTLVVGGAFTQEKDSALKVTLGASPDITADTASLNGNITVTGFADGGAGPAKASEVTNNVYTLIHTANGITGNFVNNPLTSAGLDYLLYDGYLSANGKDYNLGGFRLAWSQGLQKSSGNFTVHDNTAFDVDTVLADQAVPAGGFIGGWDGKSLTKAGNGLLALSALNTYTGKTTLNAGTLRTDVADSIASSSELNINGGVFDLNGNDQRVNRLGGTGGEVQLNGGTLTANNAAATDNTTFAGDIVDGSTKGGLTKTGDGSLTLSGKTGWTGDTHIDGGELVLDGSNGGAQLVSNIIAKDNTALSLRNGASLTGSIDPTDVNIDKASTWNMTADSLVDDVNLAGTLNFVAPSTLPMSAGHTLTANNWNGQDGTVVLNTVLGDDTSVTDKLLVNGNTSGNTFVKVNNLGGSGAQTVEGIRVVEVKGLSDGTFTKSGRIVAGAYDYSLMKKGSDWYLSSLYTTPITPTTPDTPATPDTPVLRDTPVVRPESASYTANLAAANTMFITELHDRLGETQYTDALTGEKKVTSLWLRQVGGHNSWTDSSGQLDTQSNRYVTQLGGEIAQWSTDGLQRWHLGAMAGYGNNSSNTHSDVTGYHSKGTVDGYSAGLYATWYQNDETKQGVYLDSWAQYGWFNNHVEGQDIQGESYKSSGITASLETGYTHKLGEFAGSQGSLNEWFIQPQAQAIWMGVKADDHRESNGTRVSGEGDGNLQTRLGVRTYLKGHNKIDDGKNRTFQPFVEVNWIHNTQEFGTQMDGMSMQQSGARNIGEIKTGVEGQLSPRLNLWGNVGTQVGEKGYKDTSAMVGVKYSF